MKEYNSESTRDWKVTIPASLKVGCFSTTNKVQLQPWTSESSRSRGSPHNPYSPLTGIHHERHQELHPADSTLTSSHSPDSIAKHTKRLHITIRTTEQYMHNLSP